MGAIVEELELYRAGVYHILIHMHIICIKTIFTFFHSFPRYSAFVFDTAIAGLLTISPRVVT